MNSLAVDGIYHSRVRDQKRRKKSSKQVFYFTYFSINFLWNSERSVSLTKRFSFRASSTPLAQFLNTTSSSHLKKKREIKEKIAGGEEDQSNFGLRIIIRTSNKHTPLE